MENLEFLFNTLDKDKVSLIITVISILLGFVISVSSYLVSTSIPNISSGSIKDDDNSIDILEHLSKLIEIKKGFSKYLLFIYIVIFINIGIILFIQNILTLGIFIFSSSVMFIICAYKISKIIDINLSISTISNEMLSRDYQKKAKENRETKTTSFKKLS